MTPNLTRKDVRKNLWIFLSVCLPISWIAMAIYYVRTPENGFDSIGYGMMMLSMYMPAIAAIVTCKITKEEIGTLQLFPRFRGNGKVYALAIGLGVFLCLITDVLTLVFYPEVKQLSDTAMPNMIFMILLYVAMGTVMCIASLGEEIGWMGYLFPALEKLHGTGLALVLTGVIRGLWHSVMLFAGTDFKTGMEGLVYMCISNILLGGGLVLLTKLSRSVVPAAICHALTNSVPSATMAYFVIDETAYQANEAGLNVLDLSTSFLVCVICYVILRKRFKVEKLPK